MRVEGDCQVFNKDLGNYFGRHIFDNKFFAPDDKEGRALEHALKCNETHACEIGMALLSRWGADMINRDVLPKEGTARFCLIQKRGEFIVDLQRLYMEASKGTQTV